MTGKLIGYARVSSSGQSLEVQTEQLSGAGCVKIFAEKQSGRSASDRPALQDALGYVREGDTFVVTRLDRLARSAVDLHNIVAELSQKDVAFRCLQQGGLDTATSAGKLLLGVLAAIAEFETDLRRERQREGIERTRAEHPERYRGRRPTVDREAILRLYHEGVGPTAIAVQLGYGRMTVYRALREANEEDAAGVDPTLAD